MAITPERIEKAAETVEKSQVSFHVLCDEGNRVAKKFGIVFRLQPDLREFYQTLGIDLAAQNGDQSWELPLPATYIIGSDGIIRARHIDADYVKRMEPADILAALRAIR